MTDCDQGSSAHLDLPRYLRTVGGEAGGGSRGLATPRTGGGARRGSSQPHWRLPLLSREAPLWKGLFLDIEPHIHTTSGRTLRVARIQAAYVHTSVCVCERVSALGPCAHACLRMSQAWAGACGRCCSAFLGISAPRVLTKVPQCHWRGEDNWGHSRRTESPTLSTGIFVLWSKIN